MQKTAGLLFFIAGTVALLGITLAEIFYPQAYSYSISLNMISDLAFTRSEPRIVPEPSATIFNTSLILSGILILIATYVSRKSLTNLTKLSFALLGAGAIGVGVFPEYHLSVHPLVALATFAGGSVAAIAYSRNSNYPFSVISLAFGVTSACFLTVGVFFPQEIVPVLGRGGAERLVAYPILIWLIVLGGYQMGSKVSSKN